MARICTCQREALEGLCWAAPLGLLLVALCMVLLVLQQAGEQKLRPGSVDVWLTVQVVQLGLHFRNKRDSLRRACECLSLESV